MVDKNNDYYTTVDSVLFTKDMSRLIQYPIGRTEKSYTIPAGVETIGGEAFFYCESLTTVEIPASVTSIEGYAFYACGNLSKVIYMGNELQWEDINIKNNNDDLTSAKISYKG